MNETKNETIAPRGRRPYQAPQATSREVKAVSVFHAACDCGFGCYGKFRRPSR